MIIKKSLQSNSQKGFGTRRSVILFLTFAVILLCYFLSPFVLQTPKSDYYKCDLETIRIGEFIGENNYNFGNAQSVSSSFSRSGTNSSKIDLSQNFGVTLSINEFSSNEIFRAEIWRKIDKGVDAPLIVAGGNDPSFYFRENIPNKIENGWERLQIVFIIPQEFDFNEIKIYPYSTKYEVYFDDIVVERIKNYSNKSTIKALRDNELYIEFSEEAISKLDEVRARAFNKGVLVKRKSDFVTGKLSSSQQKNIDAKIRYKGDWTDHLSSDRPSFRIKLKGDEIWNGTNEFSIQHPNTRGYIREWLYHKFMENAEVLTTNYEFISVSINHFATKLYASEEFFTKYLLERQLKREGPIFRMDEQIMWELIHRSLHERSSRSTHLKYKSNVENTALIKPFNESKILTNSSLKNQFLVAQRKFEQFRTGSEDLSEIFDIDLMARFFAISNIMGAYHSLTWHNLRFYYNPITSLIEPIGYDGSISSSSEIHKSKLLDVEIYAGRFYSDEIFNQFFYSEEFIATYYKYLYEFSNSNYIDNFFLRIDSTFKSNSDQLKKSFPAFQYDNKEVYLKTEEIRMHILPVNNCLQAFTTKASNDSLELLVMNSHVSPVKIVGYELKSGRTKTIDGPVLYPLGKKGNLHYESILVPLNAHTILIKTPGIDSLFTSEIIPYQHPIDLQQTAKDPEISSSYRESFIVKNGKEITFNTDTITIDKPIIIHSNEELVLKPGQSIHFKDDGFIVSNGNIIALGSKSNPITFKSLDGLSGGVMVSKTDNTSVFEFCFFENLNTINYQGWTLTGAVTFYESDVTMNHCVFSNNRCEDALNIVRSDFLLDNLIFQNTFGDAFDADFSTGELLNSKFIATGNDAIDFSTSNIKIQNIQMTDIGDKGISGGEMSNLTVKNVTIENAIIGIASKDKTEIKANQISFINCETAVAAYQKKPEFGPATIELYNYTIVGGKRNFMIEDGSQLKEQETRP